jgi:hypothetical protein
MTALKAIVALLVAALTAVASAVTDGRFSTVEKVQVAIAVATALAVYLAGHLPTGLTWPKTAIAAAMAALNLAVTYLADNGHIAGSQWINLLLAALAVVAVAVTPATAPGSTRGVRRADASGL